VRAEYFKAVDEATAKKVFSLLKKETPTDKILEKINKKSTVLTTEDVVYWQGQNKKFDEVVNWKDIASMVETYSKLKRSNELPITVTGGVYMPNTENEAVRILEVLQPSPQPLNEIRGLIISEYQKKLEEDWMKELYSKPIWVDYNTIISLLKK
jgi:hypothetical protein